MFYLAYSKKAAQQGMLPGQMGPSSVASVPTGPPLGQPGNDPMSALRSLASAGGPNVPTTMVIPGQQQHMPGSQMGPILVTGGTAGTLTATTQQGIMPQGGLVPQTAGLVQSLPQQPNMNPLIVQQTRFLGVGGMVSAPQLAGGPQAGMQSRPQQMLISPNVQMQRLRQPPVQPGPSPPMMQQTNQVGPQFQVPVSQSSQFQGQSPIQVSSQGPNQNQSAIPSPSQQLPPGLTVSQLGGSPVTGASYMASPSGQVVPSPMTSFSGRTPGPAGAPSPGSSLNTPANIMAATPSPGSRALQEDQIYLEKLKQLQKYVEPLRRMIARIDKDEDRKKEQSRLKSLLDILTDPNKRCPMDTLLKCEQVLEKMDLKGKPGENLIQPTIMAPGLVTSKPQEQNICQPLLDAIANHIRSPLINHTLQRTFGPVVAALCGPSTRVVSPPPKRRIEEDTCEISDVLQGEIARLDQRFKVQLDPMQHGGSRTVHLICQLDDKNLPCVPPISITVPENYPDRPPKCDINEDEYDSTEFLKRIKKVFSSHVGSMPERTSVSSFLDTWEMSVRQACAPLPTCLAIQ